MGNGQVNHRSTCYVTWTKQIDVALVDEEGAIQCSFITGFSIDSEIAPQFTILNEGPILSDLIILRGSEVVDVLLVPDVGETVEHTISIPSESRWNFCCPTGSFAAIGEGDDWTRLVDDRTNGDRKRDGNYSVTVMTRSTMPTGTMDIEIRIDNFLAPTPGNE